jgi:hypothetical protein
MLVGSHSIYNKNPATHVGGLTLSDVRGNFSKDGKRLTWFDGQAGVSRLSSTPEGYRPPGAWLMAVKAGGLASRNLSSGLGVVTYSNLANGQNSACDMSGQGGLESSIVALGLVGSTLPGTGSTTFDAFAIGSPASSIQGTGSTSIEVSAPGLVLSSLSGYSDASLSIRATLELSLSVPGTGSLDANILAPAFAGSAIQGTGSTLFDVTAPVDITTSIEGTSTFTASSYGAGVIESPISGTGSVAGDMGLVVSMVFTTTGTGAFSGNGSLVIGRLCAMSGYGDASGALSGLWSPNASLLGATTLSGVMRGDAAMLGSLAGTSTASVVTRGTADMCANIAQGAETLTSKSIATEVWNTLAAEANDPGTMGNRLNGAASSGDPWGTPLPGSYPVGTAGNAVGNMGEAVWSKLIEAGLTAEQILKVIAAVTAGKATGGGTTAVTFRDLADTKTSVALTVDSKGNRLNVTLNP